NRLIHLPLVAADDHSASAPDDDIGRGLLPHSATAPDHDELVALETLSHDVFPPERPVPLHGSGTVSGSTALVGILFLDPCRRSAHLLEHPRAAGPLIAPVKSRVASPRTPEPTETLVRTHPVEPTKLTNADHHGVGERAGHVQSPGVPEEVGFAAGSAAELSA